MNFYCSIFKDSEIISVSKLPNHENSMISATFRIGGQKFNLLNGGPMFKFRPAISMFVSCETQDEIDYFWENLSQGGKPNRCGWLEDKYGITWQIVPIILSKLLTGDDIDKSKRVMQAMMGMDKLSIKVLLLEA